MVLLPTSVRRDVVRGSEVPEAPGRVVMYVDDDETNLRLMSKVFVRHRPADRLLCVPTAADALDTAQKEPVDLVLLDLNLPGIGGTEILRTLKSQHGMPVVMLSGETGPRIRRALQALGADGYVTKPFDIVELVALIAGFLDEPSS